MRFPASWNVKILKNFFTFRFLFSFFILYLLSFILLATPARAQTYYQNQNLTPNTESNVPANLSTFTQSVFLNVLVGLTCQITGFDPTTNSHQCLGFNPNTGKIGYVQTNGGAIGFVGNMIASLYTPPAHTGDFVNYVASNFGVVKHTYAAPNGGEVSGCTGNGCGFDHLAPLLSVWTTFRNVAYLVFVLIFIAVGFMIMVRVKIDPRTVMSIENQIPKLIVALILVTFSYALSGFMIDLMNVSDYLVINLVTSSQVNDKSNPASKDFVSSIQNAEKSDLAGGNPFGFVNDVIPANSNIPGGIIGISVGSSEGVQKIIQNLFMPAKIQPSSGGAGAGWAWGAGLGTAALVGLGCAAIAGTLTFGAAIIPCLLVGAGTGFVTGITVGGTDVGDIVTTGLAVLISGIAGILAFLIIAIALLIAMFRVWFGLLLAYVGILLDIVLAPFWIIAGLFPGSEITFGAWFKDMLANLISFPVTIVMFLLAGIFANNFAQTNAYTAFVPPLIGNPFGSIGGRSPMAYIIALGMVMLTPNVVSMMREVFKAPKNTYLQNITTNLSTGVVPFSQGLKGLMGYTQKSFYEPGKTMRWRGVFESLFR